MRISVRTKLFGIVATAGAGFLVLLVASSVLARRTQRELEKIEAIYIPKVELGPSLDRRFDAMTRGFQDAVAMGDPEAVEANQDRRNEFLAELTAARDVLDREKVDALRDAVQDYYDTAHAVSLKLIRGETGVAVVDSIVGMQAKQRKASMLLEETTRFDRTQLSNAFGAAARTQGTVSRVLIGVILSCIAAVSLLSILLVGDLLRTVRTLNDGFERFGKGALDVPIEIVTNDELGDVTRHANRMADNLRRTVSELEAFNYSVSHDLRAPLRPLDGFSQALLEDYAGQLDPKAQDYLKRIRAAAQRMSQLIDDMLQLSRLGRAELVAGPCDLASMSEAIITELRRNEPGREVAFSSATGAATTGDSRLLRIALENLLRNAWKFTRKSPAARIEFGVRRDGAQPVYFVSDNGAGFDPAHARKLFQPFQRLHSAKDFEGTGIGLAIVQRIVRRHDGRVWAAATPGAGATFFFTLHEGKAST